MNSAHQTSFEPNAVPHPGETVLEYLDFYGWSQRDLARRTGLAPKTISEICSGKSPITPPTALAFEKAFQRPAHLWLNLQRHFDEAAARRHLFAKDVRSNGLGGAPHCPIAGDVLEYPNQCSESGQCTAMSIAPRCVKITHDIWVDGARWGTLKETTEDAK